MVKLSVIIPNYNHSELLPISLEAILKQSFKDLEVIVVDDASTDNSLRVLETIQSNFCNLKVISLENNQGPCNAFNMGLQHAIGDYIAMCSADDRILPGFFEKSIEMLDKYPQAGLCTSIFTYFYDDQPSKVFMNWRPNMNESCYLSPHDVYQTIKKYNFWIPGNSSIYKRTLLQEVGGLVSELKSLSDWFASLVIAFRYGICFLPENLALFRVSKKSYASIKKNNGQTNLLNILKTPQFSDVQKPFLKSGIFFQLDDRIFYELIKKSSYWKYIFRIFYQKKLRINKQKRINLHNIKDVTLNRK